ncbi:tetratricopeptide repeat domain-containing protein [Penicillium cataractarum]|uniref:Tetratricopeptide repeat domain-containing protein n=1 Tax=Penicillium cataractarum TaxID=2100454 RepID=A0A9W9SM36_9EURO|nr:tetratricopeptide repeat domain-containing protein [Penicillium cataractarum]KAJ5381093.1 tetratricopeptide repeat domain-containing protein [Penicillium cataractarum]
MLSLGNWNLPCFALADQSRNRNFVGRDHILNSMDDYLLPQETSLPADMNSIRSFAICGESGMGKTDLAIEYAYSRRSQFGAVFWLHAGSAAELMTDFCQIPGYLGLANTYSHPTPESRRKLAKAWLNNPKKSVDWGVNCRWLLIFDNADDLDVIADYIPRGGNGSILITSRSYAARDYFFEDGPGIDLDPLSTGEATALLQRLVLGADGRLSRTDQKALMKIASLSGGVPGDITRIAESIQHRSVPLRECADMFARDMARLAQVRVYTFDISRMWI